MLKAFYRRRRDAFLARHITLQTQKQFNRRNIYIVPTKAGFGFLFSVGVILFAAINYQNNSLFLFGFSILAIFLLSILATFENLHGLRVTAGQPALCQQGEQTQLELILQKVNRKTAYAIDLIFPQQQQRIEAVAGGLQTVAIPHKSGARGIEHLPRFKLETRFPFGLVRAWSYAQLTAKAYVYPAPLPIDMDMLGGHVEEQQQRRIESDDFVNIRTWQPGESPKRILWPAYARTNQLLALAYDYQAPAPAVLNWADLDGEDEVKLSILCFWVLRYTAQGQAFSLTMPGFEIVGAQGEHAKAQTLKALASYGYDD